MGVNFHAALIEALQRQGIDTAHIKSQREMVATLTRALGRKCIVCGKSAAAIGFFVPRRDVAFPLGEERSKKALVAAYLVCDPKKHAFEDIEREILKE